ncbi:MAG: diversity-generating retroelement protein Avd [Candidatus Nanohalobium sp.]
MRDMKIFQKSYDFYKEVHPTLKNFPKSERFVMVRQIQNSFLDFMSYISTARKASNTLHYLRKADQELEQVKVFFRLSRDLGFISSGQHEDISEKLVEIGKMLGGWIESEKN